MTQEDKQLLLVDISARFPYGVKVRTSVGGEIRNDKKQLSYVQISLFKSGFEDIKPYLFPLESMTEEQKQEYQYITERWMYDSSYSISDSIDWLNSHHFDYRGLIGKSLALDASGLNIY